MWVDFRWNGWNEGLIAGHRITVEEAEHVVRRARRPHPRNIGEGKMQVREHAMKVKKKWSEMTAVELAAATRQYDAEMPDLPGRPLTRAQREQFERWQHKSQTLARKRGRPRVGKGAQRITIAMERGLLKKADALARQRKMNRSQLIAMGLSELLAKAG